MSVRSIAITGATFLGIAALETIASQIAFADGGFGNDSDILGMRLTMSKDEIKKYLTDKLGVARVFDVPATLMSHDTQVTDVFGFVAQTESAEEGEANRKKAAEVQDQQKANKEIGLGDSPIATKTGDFGFNKIHVAFFPKQEGITSIVRLQDYTQSERPVVKVFFDALKAKYGEPELMQGTRFYWASQKGLSRKNQLWQNCMGEIGGLYTGTISHQDNYANWVADNIEGGAVVAIVNYVNQKKYLAQCGTILAVQVEFSDDRQYIVEMTETLVDLTKGHAAAQVFADDFFNRANKANSDQLSKDSQRKPNL